MSGVRKRSDILMLNDQTNLQEFQDFITEQLFGIHEAS
jgi:hypothetical protein